MPVQFDPIESKYFFLSAGFVYSETHICSRQFNLRSLSAPERGHSDQNAGSS